jgi:hypothetical protein
MMNQKNIEKGSIFSLKIVINFFSSMKDFQAPEESSSFQDTNFCSLSTNKFHFCSLFYGIFTFLDTDSDPNCIQSIFLKYTNEHQEVIKLKF